MKKYVRVTNTPIFIGHFLWIGARNGVQEEIDEEYFQERAFCEQVGWGKREVDGKAGFGYFVENGVLNFENQDLQIQIRDKFGML